MDARIAREVVDSVAFFIPRINSHFKEDDRWREGGWIHISDPKGEVIAYERIGAVGGPDKKVKYRKLAAEKAMRLREHPEHVTSWQSRDPDHDRWGGAIRTNDGWVFSFSGLPELWDEALLTGIVCIYEPENYQYLKDTRSPGVEPLVDIVFQIEDSVDD